MHERKHLQIIEVRLENRKRRNKKKHSRKFVGFLFSEKRIFYPIFRFKLWKIGTAFENISGLSRTSGRLFQVFNYLPLITWAWRPWFVYPEADQQIPLPFTGPYDPYSVHNNTLPDDVMSQMDPIHTLTTIFSRISFEIIFPSTSQSAKRYFNNTFQTIFRSLVCSLSTKMFT